jgi:hypothetical protein
MVSHLDDVALPKQTFDWKIFMLAEFQLHMFYPEPSPRDVTGTSG